MKEYSDTTTLQDRKGLKDAGWEIVPTGQRKVDDIILIENPWGSSCFKIYKTEYKKGDYIGARLIHEQKNGSYPAHFSKGLSSGYYNTLTPVNKYSTWRQKG